MKLNTPTFDPSPAAAKPQAPVSLPACVVPRCRFVQRALLVMIPVTMLGFTGYHIRANGAKEVGVSWAEIALPLLFDLLFCLIFATLPLLLSYGAAKLVRTSGASLWLLCMLPFHALLPIFAIVCAVSVSPHDPTNWGWGTGMMLLSFTLTGLMFVFYPVFRLGEYALNKYRP